MKILDKKRFDRELYNRKIGKQTLLEILENLLQETDFELYHCVKLVLLIAYDQKVVELETLKLEFMCIEAHWEN